MALPQMCLCFLVRRSPAGRQEVLLGRKLRGFGAGRIVGLGGKVEPGEGIAAAAIREAEEEAGVHIEPADLQKRAFVTFVFPTRRSWDQQASVFVTNRWTGDPVPSAEISPGWYDLETPPFDEMWADARHWLPPVLAGQRLTASFTYEPDLRTPATIDVHIFDEAPGSRWDE